MLKLETPWDDDEDEDVPQRHEEDDDSESDEDDPAEDDDEDDEEPLRAETSVPSTAEIGRARARRTGRKLQPREHKRDHLVATKKEPRSAALLGKRSGDDYCSAMTATVMVTLTSVCSTISIGNSPTCLSGPCDMRTCERSTSWPCFSSASTMS